MAKKATRRAGKKVAKKAGKKGGKRLSPAEKKQRAAAKQKRIKERLDLHKASTMLADFHGGKGPVKSGCGRPRGS